ncbi:hypothetical protein CHUAL_001143 [Chamberlinius hualienensis]
MSSKLPSALILILLGLFNLKVHSVWAYKSNYTACEPFFIKSLANGQLLDIDSQNMCPGAKVITCPPCNRTSQMWYIYDTGSGFIIANMYNGLLMDVDDGNTTPGSNIITWSATYACNQLWAFDHDGVIRSAKSHLVLDVCGGARNVPYGSRVIAYTKKCGMNQLFETIKVDRELLRILTDSF